MTSDAYRKMAILGMMEQIEDSPELTADAKKTILSGLVPALLYVDEPAGVLLRMLQIARHAGQNPVHGGTGGLDLFGHTESYLSNTLSTMQEQEQLN